MERRPFLRAGKRKGGGSRSGEKGCNSGSISEVTWDLLVDQMWDVKEGSERWLQGAGLMLEEGRGPFLTCAKAAGGAGLELGASGILLWTC